MTAIPPPQGEVEIGTTNRYPKAQPEQEITEDFNHSEFGGSWTYSITRIEDGKIYGKYIRGNAYTLDAEDVM